MTAPKALEPGGTKEDRGGDLVGTADPLGIFDAMAQVARRTAGRAPRHLWGLAAEGAKIAAGRSAVHAEAKDWRFTNRAWTEHPFYRRLGQAYLAWSESLVDLVDEADLDWRTKQRAEFAVRLLTSAAAPTNQFLLNPDAIERAFETGGASMLRGMRNMALDVTRNRGLPRSVVPGAYQVGSNLAATPGSVVHTNEICELIQYTPTTAEVRAQPVVVVPPQINKYYVMDLAPGRSFIEYAVARGFQMFAISWRNPTRHQHNWGLADYTEALDDAMAAAAEITRSDGVNAVGVCAGGLTTAALLARHATSGTELVHSATFAVTQLDYDVPSLMGMLGVPQVTNEAARTSRRRGVLDPASLGALFSMLRPNDLIWNYWVKNNLLGDDPPAFDVLAWNADGTCLPATLHGQFLDIVLHNSMAKGTLDAMGCPIDLKAVRCDTFCVGARNDHLVPWRACFANTQLFGGRSEFVLSSSGHIQSLVNPPGSKKMTVSSAAVGGADPDAWLASATEAPGVWWENWASWQEARSGEIRRAPTRLGSRCHRSVVPAPGRYVVNA